METREIYSSQGCAGCQQCCAAVLCCHTAKSGRAAFFCQPHSPCAAGPAPSGSTRIIVEVLCSCVCGGSAPSRCGASAEPVQTFHPAKAQGKAPAPTPHCTAAALVPTGKGSSCVQVGSERGRTSPKGHRGSGVTLFVPLEQEQGLQSTVRLTLLCYFLQEPQDPYPSPQQGLQLTVQNNPGMWGRAHRAEHHQLVQQWWEAVAKQNSIT